jgi:hypothetical protein
MKYYNCPKYFHTLQQPTQKQTNNPAVALSLTSNSSSPCVQSHTHTQNAILVFKWRDEKKKLIEINIRYLPPPPPPSTTIQHIKKKNFARLL